MNKFYNSKVFEKLQDEETRLYLESSEYVYDLFKDELNFGYIIQAEIQHCLYKRGCGDDKHDYGRGFYLTENLDLAKEWAVCRPNETNGWVHNIEKYGIDTSQYDVIKGWRANASYFYIAKEFVRDNIDLEILEELLSLGGLGIQYCIKSKQAYSQLSEVNDGLISVDYAEFNDKYNQRDFTARKNMRDHKVTNVFSTLFGR